MLHVHVSLMEGKPCKFPLQTMYRNYGYQLRTNISSKKDGGKKKHSKYLRNVFFTWRQKLFNPHCHCCTGGSPLDRTSHAWWVGAKSKIKHEHSEPKRVVSIHQEGYTHPNSPWAWKQTCKPIWLVQTLRISIIIIDINRLIMIGFHIR